MEQENGEELEFRVYPHQVSGKAPKLLFSNSTRILKGLDSNEEKFYLAVENSDVYSSLWQLRPYLPSYFGKIRLQKTPRLVVEERDWLQHLASRYKDRIQGNEFIVLENLTLNMTQPNIFDIKIGGRNLEGKTHKITKNVSQYCLKLNGCQLNFTSPVFLTKYFLGSVTELASMAQYLALFLSDGHVLRSSVLAQLINKLQCLLCVFQEVRGYRFISSSVCLLYDVCQPQLADLRLIDFGRAIQESGEFKDDESLVGMQNILKMLQGIQENKQSYQSQLSSLLDKCQQKEVSLIPEHKRTKHEHLLPIAGE